MMSKYKIVISKFILQAAEQKVTDFMVIGQGIDSHIWEEEFDLLHCSLLHQDHGKRPLGLRGDGSGLPSCHV